MLGRCGRYIAALGGLILALAVVSDGHADPRQQHQPEQSRASQRVQAQPTANAVAAIYKPDCAASKNSEDANYCIQREAVAASKEQARWALGQLVVGILGLAGLLATVVFAALAWREAERSANAALAIQRPWIRVEIRPTGKMEVGAFGHVDVPMEMRLINEGGTPALFVSHGEHGFTHVQDDIDYQGYWPVAEERAADQSRSNPGLAVFPGQEVGIDLGQILAPDLMETEDGQFTFTFGVVVTYQWGDGGSGRTKITAQLVWAPDAVHLYPDSWRFNLPALQAGTALEFEVQRREFADEYS